MTVSLASVRVVIVNNFPGPGLGGGEVQNLSVVRALLAAGAEVRAVVVRGSAFGTAVAEAGGAVAEVAMSPIAVRTAIRTIAEQIADGSPCVLMGTGYWTNLLVRQAARRTAVRVVNLVGVTPGASLADGGSRLGLSARGLVDRATASRVDAYVAVAEAVAVALVAGGAPPECVHAIPNGVDIDALRASGSEPLPPMPAGRPLIVCAARLEPVKGVEFLVRAAVRVPGATLAIAGDGALEGRLREIAVALGMAGRVAFLGRVSPIAPLLAAADVVVLPSLSEGMPLVALEAMALGRPVVATCVGGIPEVVEDGVTGILVEPRDPQALASAILRLVARPQLARALGEAGEAHVRARYTIACMTDAYVSLIASLVADSAH